MTNITPDYSGITNKDIVNEQGVISDAFKAYINSAITSLNQLGGDWTGWTLRFEQNPFGKAGAFAFVRPELKTISITSNFRVSSGARFSVLLRGEKQLTSTLIHE